MTNAAMMRTAWFSATICVALLAWQSSATEEARACRNADVKPTLAEWLDSGALVQCSDLLLNLKRLEPYGDDAAQLIGKAMQRHGSDVKLRSMMLAVNMVGDDGIAEIVKALRNDSSTGPCSLQTLNVYRNDIGDEGAAAIAEMLKRNSDLKFLHMSHNQVTWRGAAKLAKAMRKNFAIEQLWLDENGIEDSKRGQVEMKRIRDFVGRNARKSAKLTSTKSVGVAVDGDDPDVPDVLPDLRSGDSMMRRDAAPPPEVTEL
eukprot:g3850.t1